MRTFNRVTLALVVCACASGCRVDPPMPSRVSTTGTTEGGYAMLDLGNPVCQLTETQVTQYNSSDEGPERFLTEASRRVVFVEASRKLLNCSDPQLTLMEAPKGSKGSTEPEHSLATLIRCPGPAAYQFCESDQRSSKKNRWICYASAQKPAELSELPACNQNSQEMAPPPAKN